MTGILKEIKQAEKMKELFNTKSPAYCITCDGRIMGITEQTLSNEEIASVCSSRTEAFKDMDIIAIPKSTANKILDILENINVSDNESEDVCILRDAVDGIQYQTMIAWIDNYIKTAPRNPDGSFKID